MLTTTLQVALGGAIGAALRFLAAAAMLRVAPPAFPVAILSVNVLGSFLMGVFVIWSQQRGLAHLNPFVMTGILGGFTTFSAFSLDTFALVERGQIGLAAAYVVASIALSVGALFAGVALARGALA